MMMSRAQVGIERLPNHRPPSEHRESMNCKNCRKRKIKCNRLRPTCEACRGFSIPCIYDAVPKKRGPKTDVLAALLKRVDGLEKRMKTDKHDSASARDRKAAAQRSGVRNGDVHSQRTGSRTQQSPGRNLEDSEFTQRRPSFRPQSSSTNQTSRASHGELLLDTYFNKLHGKPYFILDEATTRQAARENTISRPLLFAIYANSARYAYSDYDTTVKIGYEYANRSRDGLDIDEPCIEALQTLLLLSQACLQAGRGKRAYTYLSYGITMAFALNLHRELPGTARVNQAEREQLRVLFWSCYLMDRFLVCGSTRPTLISDDCVLLRVPAPSHLSGSSFQDGEYFDSPLSPQDMQRMRSQGSSAALVKIARVLGRAHKYLARGGVKHDAHFPWHSLSHLTQIKQELDSWAAEMEGELSSLQGHSTTSSVPAMLSKLLFHLIHCIIYRAFLPLDLAELAGPSRQESWQIEATNLCILHANAITELCETWKSHGMAEWPAFVGHCIYAAGTIHVHGAHYGSRDPDLSMNSTSLLERDLQLLSEFRFVWNCAQQQLDGLRNLCVIHGELVNNVTLGQVRVSTVLTDENFFGRYGGRIFDNGSLGLTDVALDMSTEGLSVTPENPLYRLHNTNATSSTLSQLAARTIPTPSLASTNMDSPLSQHSLDGTANPALRHRGTDPSLPSPHTPHLTSTPSPQSINDLSFAPASSTKPLLPLGYSPPAQSNTPAAFFSMPLGPPHVDHSHGHGHAHHHPHPSHHPQALLHALQTSGHGPGPEHAPGCGSATTSSTSHQFGHAASPLDVPASATGSANAGGMGGSATTPSEEGGGGGGEDPFLNVLEQLAESEEAGPLLSAVDLDYF